MGESEGTETKTIKFEEQIDLREIWHALLSRRLIIASITILSAISSVFYALSIPDIYTSKAVLASKKNGGSAGLSQLASQFSGLASFAGVSARILFRWNRR